MSFADHGHPLTHRLLGRLRSELDSAFDRFAHHVEFPSVHGIVDLQHRLRHGAPLSSIAGAIDLVEEDNLFRISAELPGVEAKDIDVSASDTTLIVKANKQNERNEQAQTYYLHEREYGLFQRFVEIPAGVDHNKIEATFTNGVLTIELPKMPNTVRQHKKIRIQDK